MDNTEDIMKNTGAAVGMLGGTDVHIIENLNYDDYLSSVYTYEDACEASRNAQINLAEAEKEFKGIKAELDQLLIQNAKVTDERDKIIAEETAKREEIWKKNQARFDVLISTKKALAETNASKDIANKKEEYRSSVDSCKKNISSLHNKIASLDKSYAELKEQQKKFNNFTGADFPPADDKALAVLKRAYEKKLLTKGQEELLAGDVDKPCKQWLSGFDSLIDIEKEFTGTEFYQKLVEGRVTRTVIEKLAAITAIAAGILTALLCVVLAAFEPNIFSIVVHTIVGTLALGAFFASLTHLVRERFEKVRSLPVPERAMIIMAFLLGAVIGFFTSAFIAAPARGAASLVFFILCSAVCGLLDRRLLMTKLACKYLSKVTFLKDKARKELFSEYENAEDGRYSFMIYCYLCHEAVLLYLSMEYRQMEIDSIRKKIDFNRKDSKHYSEQLETEKQRLEELKSGEQTVKDFERERSSELAKEIADIESKRPALPDFGSEVRTACASKLDPLEKEHKELSAKIARLSREAKILEEENTRECETAEKLRAQKKLIATALRQWKKTPIPAATDYKIVGKLCIDSKSSLKIVTHDCEPIVLMYKPKQFTKTPAESAAPFIYKYIRGLCKINPRRLMQVNIFDYVSDPKYYSSYQAFESLSTAGVIPGVYSQRDFEIRLFSSVSGYRTFKDFFRLRFSRLKTFIDENSSSLPEGRRSDLADIDRLAADDGSLFLYQICLFVVPRKDDVPLFHPPKSLLDLIDKGLCKRLGMLPVFIADSDNIADEWKPVVEKYKICDHIFSIN